jgi:hypothetical protein
LFHLFLFFFLVCFAGLTGDFVAGATQNETVAAEVCIEVLDAASEHLALVLEFNHAHRGLYILLFHNVSLI